MAVTPVRTGPLPTMSLPEPEMSVVWPTSTPFTSVMALLGPGVPSKGTPRSRARGLGCAAAVREIARMSARIRGLASEFFDIGPPGGTRKYKGWALGQRCGGQEEEQVPP